VSGEGPLALVRQALVGRRAWLVGGTLRDRLLGRPAFDFDLVVEGDAEPAARAFGRAARAATFPLSDAFGAWRTVGPGHAWQVDFTPLAGAAIEQDLAARDFTVNAIAEPLEGGEPLDPHGGRADLAAGRLRMVSEGAFAADPLRVLRAARLSAELGLEPEPETRAAARRHAAGLAGVAAERVFAELKRILVSPDPLRGLAEMTELGATAVVLPELAGDDARERALAALAQVAELERDPRPLLGEELAPAVRALLAEPLADELDRGGALRFGALLGDVADPREVLARLRGSERLRAHVADLARNRTRIAALAEERPLDRRAVYRYLKACGPAGTDVTLLAAAEHPELARELLPEALRWRERRPVPPLRGDDLVDELRIAPGPEVGRLLAELEEAQFAGEIATREDALARARLLHAR
jgi:tRNA nucleotidyltransferase/poly(A) polymerase